MNHEKFIAQLRNKAAKLAASPKYQAEWGILSDREAYFSLFDASGELEGTYRVEIPRHFFGNEDLIYEEVWDRVNSEVKSKGGELDRIYERSLGESSLSYIQNLPLSEAKKRNS